MFNYKLSVTAATLEKPGRPNQDNFIIDKYVASASRLNYFECMFDIIGERKTLFGVFDGIGGVKDGDRASHIASTTFYGFLDDLKKGLISIEDMVDSVNTRIVNYYETFGEGLYGGTTMTLLYIDGNIAKVFNIGDSPQYLVNKNRKGGNKSAIRRLFCDHTLAAEKNIKSDRKKEYESNVLTQFMGNPNERASSQMYAEEIELCKGDVFVLCSDGVIKGLSEEKIKKEILADKYYNMAQYLVESAKKHGAKDDITALIVRVEEDR